MNIFKKEIKQNFKPFIFWTLGIGFLIFGGMVKFLGVQNAGDNSLQAVIEIFPKPVLAMLGMAEGNISTFAGFYGVLEFYVLVGLCCYAIQLGSNAVLRENIDKTYEFLYTKPVSRNHILTMKLLAGVLFLTVISLLNIIFSYLTPELYGIENSLNEQMLLFGLAIHLISMLYFSVTILLSTLIKKSQTAIQLSYVSLLIGYALAVMFDLDEKFEVVRCLTPFKYFRASELSEGVFPVPYLLLTLIIIIVCMIFTYRFFKRKDLNAV